ARSGADANAAVDLQRTFGAMIFSPLLAILAAAWILQAHPQAIGAAAPLLFAWFVSPAIAWWLSRPRDLRVRPLATEQLRFLRMLSRRTWGYFEEFVDAENHWLPPDNYQEAPVERVAHRTSPTNIGFALTANLAAYDFGYLTAGDLLDRTEHTLATMASLERFQGHLYNWYDTRTLQPLRPMYVSSVDSGNLAGLLLTLRPGLLALVDAPILSPRAIDGVHDTLQVLLETAGATPRAAAARRAFAELAAAADECVAAIAATNDEIARSAADTDALRAGSAASQAGARDGDRAAYAHDPDEPSFFDVDPDTEAGPEADVQTVIDEPDEAPLHPHALQRSPAVETLRWARALSRQCHAVLDELYALAPAGIESGRAAR